MTEHKLSEQELQEIREEAKGLYEALDALLKRYHRVYAMADLPWEDYRGKEVQAATDALNNYKNNK